MTVVRYVAKLGRASSFLVGGSLASQFIFLGISPVITRLYSPDEFAVLNVFTSLTALFAAFAVLRLDVAVFTVSKSLSSSITVMSVYIAAFISAMLAACFYVFCLILGVTFVHVDLIVMSSVLAIGIFGTAVFGMVTNSAVRWGLFREVGTARVYQTIVGGAVQVAAGFAGFGVLGLITGQILSQALGTTGIWRIIIRHSRFSRVSKRFANYLSKYVGVKFRRYAIYSAPSSVVNRFVGSMVIVLFATIYDFTAVGLLALTFRAANGPMLAVARGVSQIFQKEYAESGLYSQRQVALIFIGVLFAIGMVPVAILYLWGPQLFVLVFGERWELAGVYAAILSPAFLLQFVAYPLTQSMSLSNNQHIQLLWDLVRSVFLAAVFVILYWYDVSAANGVALISFSLGCIYFSQILISIKLSGTNVPKNSTTINSEL